MFWFATVPATQVISRYETNSYTRKAGSFRLFKLVYEMDVAERLISNSLIELKHPGIIIADLCTIQEKI